MGHRRVPPMLSLVLLVTATVGYPHSNRVRADPGSACPVAGQGPGPIPVVSEISALPTERYSVTGGDTRVLAGHVAHGMKDMEVLLVQLKKGEGTPIISHPQEKVLITLSGSGVLLVLNGTGPSRHALGDNSTATVHPGLVHQILSSESEGLQLLTALADPPAKTLEFASWEEAFELSSASNEDLGNKAEDAPWNKCLNAQQAAHSAGNTETKGTTKEEL